MQASGTRIKRPLGRLELVGFACTLSMNTYLDRVCFGAAVPFLNRDLGLKDISHLKCPFTTFSISFATFEVPSGLMVDDLLKPGIVFQRDVALNILGER